MKLFMSRFSREHVLKKHTRKINLLTLGFLKYCRSVFPGFSTLFLRFDMRHIFFFSFSVSQNTEIPTQKLFFLLNFKFRMHFLRFKLCTVNLTIVQTDKIVLGERPQITNCKFKSKKHSKFKKKQILWIFSGKFWIYGRSLPSQLFCRQKKCETRDNNIEITQKMTKNRLEMRPYCLNYLFNYNVECNVDWNFSFYSILLWNNFYSIFPWFSHEKLSTCL